MTEDELTIMLQRIETAIQSETKLSEFLLMKFIKNVEFAQTNLLELEDSQALSTSGAAYRLKISELQAKIAHEQFLINEALANERLRSRDSAQTSTPVNNAEDTILTTEEHVLQTHRETQGDMSEELLTMARTLRENQQKFGESIVADNELIEKTAEALQRNSGKMEQTGGRLSKYSRKSSWSWVYTYLAILVAISAFLVTIGLIRIT